MKFCLNNGVTIPSPGFGTFNIGESSEVYNKIVVAAECGFRHFDTASAYKNEEEVGKGISYVTKEICPRNEMFITGKISNEDLQNVSDGYYAAKQAFERTVEKMQLDYLDARVIIGLS